MSTRRLIIAALLCGVAILVAGTILLIQAGDAKKKVDQGPLTTSATRG